LILFSDLENDSEEYSGINIWENSQKIVENLGMQECELE
jgi:hypothetical protein